LSPTSPPLSLSPSTLLLSVLAPPLLLLLLLFFYSTCLLSSLSPWPRHPFLNSFPPLFLSIHPLPDRRRGRDRFNRERDVEDYDADRRRRDFREGDSGRGGGRDREYRDREYLRDTESRDRQASREWDRGGAGAGGSRWDDRRDRGGPPSRDDFGRDRRDASPPRKRRWDPPGAVQAEQIALQQQQMNGMGVRPQFPLPQPGQDVPSLYRFNPASLTNPYAPILTRPADPNLDTLLTFKQYLETQDPNIDPEEATRRYATYKTEHTSKQLGKFFAAHKLDEWFLEKYHPTPRTKRDQEKAGESKAALAIFTQDLAQDKYASLTLDDPELKAHSGTGDSGDQLLHDEDMVEQGEAQGDRQSHILFIKTVPPNLKRAQIVELCQKVPGFVRLELSEPNPAKKFFRVGWVTYAESTDITEAHAQLNDTRVEAFEFHFGIFKASTAKNLKIPPVSSTEDRTKKDFFLIKKLVALLDREKNLENPLSIPETADTLSEIKRLLDLLIVYLRKVHFYDYYSALEFESEDALERKCGGFPIRMRSTEVVPDPSWERNLDSKIETRLKVTLDEETSKKLGKRDREA